MHEKSWILVSALLLGGPGCIIDGVTLPELDRDSGDDSSDDAPVNAPGTIDSSLIFYSFYSEDSGGPVLIAGAPTALPGAGRLLVSNLTRPQHAAQAQVATDGSFNVPLNAAMGEQVQLTYVVDDQVRTQLTLSLYATGARAEAAADGLDASLDSSLPAGSEYGGASPPDGAGLVLVTGPAGTIEGGLGVVVANVTLGTCGFGTAAADGSFAIQVQGRSGDQLLVFAVDPQTSPAGGPAVTLYVP